MWFDSKALKTKSFDLANDNRWLALLDLEVDSVDTLTQATENLSETLDTIMRQLDIKRDTGPVPRVLIPRKIRNLLNRYKKHSGRIADLVEDDKPIPDTLRDAYVTARKKFRQMKRKFERRQKQKLYARIAEDFLVYDHKNVWSRL